MAPGTHSSSDAITVVVADDHPGFHRGLGKQFERASDIVCLEVASDGLAALEATRRLRPNVLVLDVRLPRLDGVEVLRDLRDANDPQAVLMTSANITAVVPAVSIGVNGFLPKTVPGREFLDGIRAVARGELVLHDDARELVSAALQARALRRTPVLRPRQREVLQHLANGHTMRDIAGLLGISESTVKKHAAGVYRELGVTDRAAAVAVGIRQGLIG